MPGVERFDIIVVNDKFEASLNELEDDVRLEEYLDSFEELNKFFTLMGSVFKFVSQDLEDKIGILKRLRSDAVVEFSTVRTMIEHESSNELLRKKGYTSGSRTLLRLHRGLAFIHSFLSKLKELKDDDWTSNACKEAYNETLYKHHTLVVRTGAALGIYALPTRGALLQKVCGEEVESALALLPKTLESMSTVYDRIDGLYTSYDLHGLP